jgi:acetyltransferase-like isoleucine patch superfamily enzyme
MPTTIVRCRVDGTHDRAGTTGSGRDSEELAVTAFRFRRYLRMVTYAIGLVLAIPLSLPFIAFGWLAILVDRYSEMSVVVAHIPFYLGEHIRYLYYRTTLKKLGRPVTFKFGSFCQYRGASIGDRVVIGYYDALGLVSIGHDVSIGGFVNMTSGRHQHAIDDPSRLINQQPGKAEMIRIDSDVWIGSNCVISASIGNRCVIGSGSVVVKDVPDHSIYAGNPARFIRALE